MTAVLLPVPGCPLCVPSVSPPPGAAFCMSDQRGSDFAADALLWRSKRRGVNSSFGEAKVVKDSPQAIITYGLISLTAQA